MPRAEFDKVTELKRWLKEMMARSKKYIAYYTEKDELIIQPTTSTAPVTYGYVDGIKTTIAEDICKDADITLVRVKRFEWSSENQVKRE